MTGLMKCSTRNLLSTKKAKKSSRGNAYCQIFVTDKGHVMPMKSEGVVPQALEQFAKESGAPEAIVLDPPGEQTSQEVKKFVIALGQR